jgi:hypothetical protein
MAINPYLFAKLPYDAIKDFVPVTQLVYFPQVVVTSPKQAFKSLPEFIAAAKAQPDKLAHASSGAGTTSHLVMELVKADAGIKLTHVGYRGGAPAVQAVMAGDVQVGVEGLPSLVGQIKSGAVVALGVTSLKRSPQLPGEPAISESIPGFDATAWLTGPAGFGYSDKDDATQIPNMRNHFRYLCIRREFDLPGAEKPGQLRLNISYDDGFIAYLNGREVLRINAETGSLDTIKGVSPHEANGKFEVYPMAIPLGVLKAGKNVLALEGYNDDLDSSDLTLHPSLFFDPEAGAAAPEKK